MKQTAALLLRNDCTFSLFHLSLSTFAFLYSCFSLCTFFLLQIFFLLLQHLFSRYFSTFLLLLQHLLPSTLLQHLSPSTSAPFTFYSTSAPFLLLLQQHLSFFFSTFSPSTSTPYLLLLQTFSPSTSAPFLLLLQHLFHSTYFSTLAFCFSTFFLLQQLFPPSSALFLLLLYFSNFFPSPSAPFSFYFSTIAFYFSTFFLLQHLSPSTSAPFLLLLQHLSYSSLAPVPSYCTVVQHLSSSITYNL